MASKLPPFSFEMAVCSLPITINIVIYILSNSILTLNLRSMLKYTFLLPLCLAFFLLATLSASGQDYPPIPKQVDNPGVGVQKFIKKLNEGQTVTLAYFGQSLHSFDNAWTTNLATYLSDNFPGTVNVVNRAIPGCGSYCLRDEVVDQLGGVDPDLIIMQDYSGSYQSYNDLVNNIKSVAPNAEVLLWNDHVSVANRKDQVDYFDNWAYNELPIIVSSNGYGLFDIRTAWKAYLQTHYGDPYDAENITELLRDSVHFNDQGQWLVFNLMKNYFVVRDEDQGPSSTTYQAENSDATDTKPAVNYWPGYTGTGFVEYSGATYLEWNVNSDGAATVDLDFRYANGSDNNRNCEVIVNNTPVGLVTFDPTGSWTDWNVRTRQGISLRNGENTIRLQTVSGFNGPNLDYMKVINSASEADNGGAPTTPPSGGDGTAYRYLRLTLESGKSVSVQEVSWLVNGTSYPKTAVTAMGQTNAQGTTVLGASYLSDYKLYNKLDDCSGGHLFVGGNLPKSVVLDLGEGNAIAPDALMISKCPSSWSELSGFTAEGSADQSAWVVLGEFSGLGSGDFPGEVGTFNLTSGTSARQASGIQEKVVIGSGLEHAEVVVYPNPSTGMVQVVLPESSVVRVHNSLGQLVLEQQLVAGQSTLDLSELGHGMHLLSTKIEGRQQVRRLLLE